MGAELCRQFTPCSYSGAGRADVSQRAVANGVEQLRIPVHLSQLFGIIKKLSEADPTPILTNAAIKMTPCPVMGFYLLLHAKE